MKRMVLVTSSCGFEQLGNAREQIGIIPLHLRFDGQEYLDDGSRMTLKTLSEMMMENPKKVAGTRPASEDEVHEIFADLYYRGYSDIFVCCLSSRFSESYNILQRQQSIYVGRMNIYIYDTKTANLGEAALAYEANYMLQAGAPFSQIIERLDTLRANNEFNFTLHDLSYIISNKKLSTPAGFVANLFDIRPIMHITHDGLISPKDKVRKFERALKQIISDIDTISRGQERYIYLANLGNAELAEYCSYIVMDELGLKSLPIIPVSCVSISNHGPEGVGLGLFYGQLPKIISQLPVYKEI
ncbi:MAG: DegV family protein [Moraxella sp.]|nr:DegV family protein [Moraxella sp.]